MLKVLRDWIQRYFSDEEAVVLAVVLVLGFTVVLTLGNMLAPVLAGLVLAVLVLFRVPGQHYLRFPLTTFIPVAFLLAYLREGAYRVGYGDSLARMTMHVVPLAVLYVIAVTVANRSRPSSGAPAPAAGSEDPEVAPPGQAHDLAVSRS